MKTTQEPLLKVEGFTIDADTHSYFMDGKPMTGCTTILGVIAKPALVGWAARTAVEVIGSVWRGGVLYTKIEVAQKLDEAKKAYAKKRDDAAEKGTDLHSVVEDYVHHCISVYDGQPVEVEGTEPIAQFIKWAQDNKVRFIESEKQLYSKDLWVAGTCDLVFEKEGKTYVGDVKTYAKIWDRTPFFQCAGYAIMYSEMYKKEIDGYCILRLSKDGTFEDKWSWDVEGDKRAFLACVQLYRQLKTFK